MTVSFSIFIPVWNDARWLPGAIESVLSQSHRDWEIVIGDNVSTEDVRGVVAAYADPRIRYHRWDEHVDFASNANRTLALCSLDWVQYLSADDRLLPGCLQAMAACVEQAEGAGQPLSMVLTGCARYDEAGAPAEHVYFGTWRLKRLSSGIYDAERWLRENAAPGAPPWNIGSMALRATTVRMMGGYFREEVGLSPDLEVALRVAAYGPVGYVEDALLHYTVRADSITRGLSRRNLERREPLPPVAAALTSALAVHEHRRAVSAAERRYVLAQVADQLVGRAVQQRYLDGGRGRRGALGDVAKAIGQSPRSVLRPRQLVRIAAALLAPGSVLRAAKARLMRTRTYL